MLTVISPAKKLDMTPVDHGTTTPVFRKRLPSFSIMRARSPSMT